MLLVVVVIAVVLMPEKEIVLKVKPSNDFNAALMAVPLDAVLAGNIGGADLAVFGLKKRKYESLGLSFVYIYYLNALLNGGLRLSL